MMKCYLCKHIWTYAGQSQKFARISISSRNSDKNSWWECVEFCQEERDLVWPLWPNDTEFSVRIINIGERLKKSFILKFWWNPSSILLHITVLAPFHKSLQNISLITQEYNGRYACVSFPLDCDILYCRISGSSQCH